MEGGAAGCHFLPTCCVAVHYLHTFRYVSIIAMGPNNYFISFLPLFCSALIAINYLKALLLSIITSIVIYGTGHQMFARCKDGIITCCHSLIISAKPFATKCHNGFLINVIIAISATMLPAFDPADILQRLNLMGSCLNQATAGV